VTAPVVFVAHQASRTGSPAVLLTFVRWLRDHSDLDFEILVWRGGPLVADFAAVAPTDVVMAADGPSLARLVDTPALPAPVRRTGRAARAVRLRQRLRRLGTAELLWLNSAESGQVLRYVDPPATRVVSHVHELEMALTNSMPERAHREHWLARTDRFVAVADRVAADLVEHHGIDPDRIERHYEFLDAGAVTPPPKRDVRAVRRGLGVGPDVPLVGASGTRGWRKGFDLFLQLARSLACRPGGDGAHLVWLGGDDVGAEPARLADDVRRLGLPNHHVVDTVDDPRPWFGAFDVFVLTSREDPYPLVCLEAGLLGRPVVAFDCGGMTELLDGDNGIVVPALAVEAMADEVTGLLADPGRRDRLGERLGADVRARHDVSVAAPPLYELLARQLSRSG
jgi:glycosyltransferase involved in cell wall biosynthesis